MSIDNTYFGSSKETFQHEKITLLSDDKVEQLKKLSLELDPFAEISKEQKLELALFGITDLSDPFAITNQILKILEENLNYRLNTRQENGKESRNTSSKH